jgi:hypothetical protein
MVCGSPPVLAGASTMAGGKTMPEHVPPEEMHARHALEVPYAPAVNRHRAAAAAHTIDWLRHHSMLGSEQALALYQRWSIDGLVARALPEIDKEGLELGLDMFAFLYLFDDQFDAEPGARRALTWAVCRRLIDIAHGDLTEAGASPLTEAFADVWARLSHGRSPEWIARASYNWEVYFASYPNESLRRAASAEERASGGRAAVPGRAMYLQLRRGVAGCEPTLDSFESAYGVEVPRLAFHSPELRLLRQYACDIPAFSNDVYSYNKEVARGDVNNLVLVVQSQKEYTVSEARAEVLQECQWMLDQCQRLAAGVPRLCRRLGLAEDETAAVSRYARILTDWAYGYPCWEAYTPRYHDDCLLPADAPNYVEDLMAPRPPRRRPFVVA